MVSARGSLFHYKRACQLGGQFEWNAAFVLWPKISASATSSLPKLLQISYARPSLAILLTAGCVVVVVVAAAPIARAGASKAAALDGLTIGAARSAGRVVNFRGGEFGLQAGANPRRAIVVCWRCELPTVGWPARRPISASGQLGGNKWSPIGSAGQLLLYTCACACARVQAQVSRPAD